ncbi:sorting nexin-19a [Thalassophryne amazonica]|uniref:sorting nexin-19a n=1 Tax=Thalassophryne amazonica TaxID=390379 RepID=UPI001471FE15|nr:sorting nexin-19a [Thalassophryne amazonica]XP_034034487.1 sorting nexin-19a [Thalassophryne amazonica]
MPSSKISKLWALSDIFGLQRLLGVGAVVAWLILFHLLVNVWLLCIFTSLLVVLGGWLGCRALLDANSLLHLEHFLPLGKHNPPLYCPEHEQRLNHELHSIVHKAMRDFVSSWSRTLLPGEEGEFEQTVRDSMLEVVMELKQRARKLDRKVLVQRLLELYGCHLQSYMTAKQMCLDAAGTQIDSFSLWQCYSDVDVPHPAVRSTAAELTYASTLVNLILHVLVPYPQMETRTGSYMVTELITYNVLLPLISRVSDPDLLNQTIVEIFTRSREPQQINMDKFSEDNLNGSQIHNESWTTCNSLSSSDQADVTSESSLDLDGMHSQESLQSSTVSLTSDGKVERCSAGLLIPCRMTCCYGKSGHCSNALESKTASSDSLIQSDSEDDLSGSLCDCGPPTNICTMSALKDDEGLGCFGPLKTLGPKVVVPMESQWPTEMAHEQSPACRPRRFHLTSYNFNNTANPVAPANIQNIQIAGNATAVEQRGSGTHAYTLYIIKFEMAVGSGNCDAPPRLASHTVHRRYSEFLNLQTRLEEKPVIKKLIKSVKGPKKLFPDLPFSSADSEKVEARKTQLDIFLKQLSSIPETAASEDMQEFLALNSGVCTYFGRKPFVKSRIDKMVENALDTLKTAFPQPEIFSPTEDLEGDTDGRTMDNRKYRLVFPSKVSPSVNVPDLHPKVSYCFSEGSTMLNGMSLSGLESFIREQERLLCRSGEETGAAVQSREQPSNDKKTSEKTHGTDTAVADVALNILCLLMKDQLTWLCTENIQKTIRLLFGTFIERWLDVRAAHLTSAPCWVIYLQVIQEAVWPGGVLPAEPRPERSAMLKQETKDHCLECLMQLLPEFVTDMLGSEKYRLSLEVMLDSIQDHHINKHLLYCICDLLLEFLIPESCDEDFQRSLLQSVAKNEENLRL